MVRFTPHITRFGAQSLLVQIASDPSPSLLQWLLCKREVLIDKLRVEVIHTYNELLIKNCISPATAVEVLIKQVALLLQQPIDTITNKKKVHRIPVCYAPEFAPDLEAYTAQKSLAIPDIIRLHTDPVYPIYFMGFLPGFPYLEGLDTRLYVDRKANPARSIATGSVAIGGKQTGIYTQTSPGGWHVIGRTPLSLFNREEKQPTRFKAGEYIKFYAITVSEFNNLQVL